MKFSINSTWGRARTGTLSTPHGEIATPVFMPVGTKASVKAVSPEDLIAMGADIILGNTYHLYLRPGDELINNQGGLHQFANWNRSMLTDSGGFQVSSLGNFQLDRQRNNPVRKPVIDDQGVKFYSHLDGAEHYIDAEKSIQIQSNLGADIIMAFDEATPDLGEAYAKIAMERTHDWLLRSIQEWKRQEKIRHQAKRLPQALFGIIQGGNYQHLRQISAEFVVSLDLPGIAIGGGSIGANKDITSENTAWIWPYLDRSKPLYLMGVGVTPEDVIAAILDGADMFDCVAPTRLARTGILYNGEIVTDPKSLDQYEYVVEYGSNPQVWYVSHWKRGRIQISNQRYTQDSQVLMESCGCYTCTNKFTRAYLRHLFLSKELLYYRLASIHNLFQMIHTAKRMAELIRNYS